METFLKIVQQELKTKKRLTINDVIALCNTHNHYLDTARRNLEPDKTPFSRPYKIGGKIKWWDYVPEATTSPHRRDTSVLEPNREVIKQSIKKQSYFLFN